MSNSINIVFMLGLVASVSACTHRVGGGAGAAGAAVHTGAVVATEKFVIVERGLIQAPVINSKYR